jgi:hypothetical protein
MQLKRVNPKALLYHYFERSVTEFALYDDELDMPVAYGSKNLVDSMVRSFPKTITIIYYKRDVVDKFSFKKYIIYDGQKSAAHSNTG